MALTAAQLNAHLRVAIQDEIVAQGEALSPEAWFFLLRACIRHWRLGDADSQEAARTIAQFVFESKIGRPAGAGDLHSLRQHEALYADPTAVGVL